MTLQYHGAAQLSTSSSKLSISVRVDGSRTCRHALELDLLALCGFAVFERDSDDCAWYRHALRQCRAVQHTLPDNTMRSNNAAHRVQFVEPCPMSAPNTVSRRHRRIDLGCRSRQRRPTALPPVKSIAHVSTVHCRSGPRAIRSTDNTCTSRPSTARILSPFCRLVVLSLPCCALKAW